MNVELSKRDVYVLMAALMTVADGKTAVMEPSSRHEVLTLHDRLKAAAVRALAEERAS